jgi:hypothetical protein
MNQREITAQQISLMGYVEEICEQQGLVPPVEVNIMEASGNQYDIEYCPESDWVDLPPVPIMPPVMLDFTDATGIRGGTAAIGLCTIARMEKALPAVSAPCAASSARSGPASGKRSRGF